MVAGVNEMTTHTTLFLPCLLCCRHVSVMTVMDLSRGSFAFTVLKQMSHLWSIIKVITFCVVGLNTTTFEQCLSLKRLYQTALLWQTLSDSYELISVFLRYLILFSRLLISIHFYTVKHNFTANYIPMKFTLFSSSCLIYKRPIKYPEP
jgi:hypothetical protein